MLRRVFLIFLLLITNLVLFSLDIQKDIIQKGSSLIGTPYKLGGVSPGGFDCSGFINYLYKPFAPGIPRISRQIADYGTPLQRDAVQPGDLLFFATGSSPRTITHVAIYIGQDSILHAISNGPDRGVTITSLSARYWKNKYFSAARVLPVVSEKQREAEGLRFAKGYYTGEISGGEPEGYGTLEMDNGDRYEGMFLKGTFHGAGTYTWKDGQTQTGEFRHGQFHSDSQTRDYYINTEESPWETFDGPVDGDFALWYQQEQDSFEEWKKHN